MRYETPLERTEFIAWILKASFPADARMSREEQVHTGSAGC